MILAQHGTADVNGGYWLSVRDGDLRALALYLRHYSAKKFRSRYHIVPIGNRARFVGTGEQQILMTAECDALFAWRLQRIRKDGQTGVECSVFRSERGGQKPPAPSELIAEAIGIAWRRWPEQRLFTFIDPREIRSANPGYCFKVAGFRNQRTPEGKPVVTRRGLHVLELLPEWAPEVAA